MISASSSASKASSSKKTGAPRQRVSFGKKRMFLLKQIAPAVLVALMVAVGVSALARWLKGPRASSAVAAFALGAAYFCGHLVNTGWFGVPPTDTTNWLPFFALAAAVLGALDSTVAVHA